LAKKKLESVLEEPKIETDDQFGGVPAKITYAGVTDIRRIGPCCIEIEMGQWRLRLNSRSTIDMVADCNDGRRHPPA
jgi:hypothetical protein